MLGGAESLAREASSAAGQFGDSIRGITGMEKEQVSVNGDNNDEFIGVTW